MVADNERQAFEPFDRRIGRIMAETEKARRLRVEIERLRVDLEQRRAGVSHQEVLISHEPQESVSPDRAVAEAIERANLTWWEQRRPLEKLQRLVRHQKRRRRSAR